MPDTSSSFVSVKFDAIGRRQRFLLPESTFDAPLSVGENVVVALGDRSAYGTVVRSIPELDDKRRPPVSSQQRVLRRASQLDVVQRLKQERREREGYRVGVMKIKERGLAMKLVKVVQPFDGSKLIYYFTADSRVDYRDLVRDLASEFRCRIEMRQMGARDEARLLGGYGTCGRPLCCTTWLPRFESVSMKMAKQQNLSLNPSRLSGLCGRLKCCLRYELPNAAGESFAGCANESRCSRSGGGCRDGCSGECSTCSR